MMSMSTDHAPTRTWRPKAVAGALSILLICLTFLAFSPSLNYALVHIDDIAYVSNNTSLHGGLTPSGVRQAFSPGNTTATMYMPLLWISYMLDVEWLGATPESPWGFHFTNVLLHALNAGLAALLLVALGANPWHAFILAALWALHPLRVESVAWVSGRKDVLSGFFALLCLGTYLWAERRQRGPRSPSNEVPAESSWQPNAFRVASLICFALGLLVKPALVPLPIVLLLLDAWRWIHAGSSADSLRRAMPRLLLNKVPFFLLSALAAAGTVWGHHVVSGEIPAPALQRLLSIPLSYGFYLLKTVIPRNLTVLYPHWADWLTLQQALAFSLAGALAVAGLTWRAWLARQRSPHWLVGWLWFLAMLLPVSGIVPIPTNDVADRFTYFPALGLSVALLHWLQAGSRGPPAFRRMGVPLGVLAVAAVALLSWRQLPAWRDADSLTRRVLDVFPTHATALETHAGNLMRATGNFREADRLLTIALESDPHHWKALLAKAQCLWALEGPEAAHAFLDRRVPPTSRNTRSQWQRDLARYALMLGRPEDAIRHAEQAMALLPPQDLAQTPLLLLAMTAAYEAGDTPRTLAFARRYPPYAGRTAIELADLLPHAIFQWVAGYRGDTVAYFQRLLRSHPDRPDYLNNAVWGLATADWSPVDPHEVLDMANRLSGMFPEPNPGILDTASAAQANAGHFEDAARTMREALTLLPPSADPGTQAFRQRLASRLELYEQGHPYREDAFLRMYATYYGAPAAIQPPAP